MHAPTDTFTSPPLELESDPPQLPGAPHRAARPSSHRPSPKPRPPGRGRLIFLLVVVLAVLAVAFIAGLAPRLLHRRAVAQESRSLAISTVAVVSPAPAKAMEPLALTGELRALVEAPIYARATGYVRRWLVDLGAQVEAGQLLAELDTPDTDRELLEARADLKQAEAARDLSQTTSKRWVQMLNNRTVSAQEAEEKEGDFATKGAAVEAAGAKVQRLEELARFAKITAPFAGTVTARLLDVGQLVNATGGRELFRISQTNKLRVFVHVPQTYSRSVLAGQKAELSVPELPGRTFQAEVVRSAGAMDISSRTLLVELEADNAQGDLLAGSYAQVRMTESQPPALLTIPANCLLFRAEGPQVGTVDGSNRVTLQTVKLGRDYGPVLEILSGVNPQDRVILNPPDALVSGIEVRVQPAKEAGGKVTLNPGMKNRRF